MAFRDYIAELTGAIPRLPEPHAEQLINRAWAEIRDIRTWSFLNQQVDLIAPAPISVGTISVTQFSNTFVADATAAAALNVAGMNPPLAQTSIGQGRQIRIGNGNNYGPVYSIVSWDGTTTGTLDRLYAGSTDPTSPYTVYRAYFAVPGQDFIRYRAITNPTSGYAIVRDALIVPQSSLDIFDPQRASTGDAYYLSPFLPDSSGLMCHEFYPHPTNPAVYNCLFQRRGLDLSDSLDLPLTFPAHVLMHRAYMLACDWALRNVALYPELQQTNWVQAKQSAMVDFRSTIITAIRQDDELRLIGPRRVGRFYSSFPLGGQWLQGHALPPSSTLP